MQEQLEAVVTAAVQQATAAYQQHQAALIQEFQELRAATQATRPEMAAGTAARQPTVVDTRLLGRPDSFGGSAKWKDCSVVFRSYAGACLPSLMVLVDRAKKPPTPVLSVNHNQNELACSLQSYFMLMMLCKSTALTQVINSGSQEGLEAWRLLVGTHEPSSQIRSAGLLQELRMCSFEGDISARIAQYGRDVDRYDKSSGTIFPQNILIGVALRMLPEFETTPPD